MQKLWSISLIKYSLSSVHEMTSRKSEMLLNSVLIDNCANLALHSMFSSNFSEFLANITHPFNGPYSGTTRVSQYQKVKTNLDFTEARDSEWKWHQLGHMQVCTSLQTDNHASTPPLSFFTGRMPFLPPNQQSQSTGHIQHWRIYDKSK